MDRLISKLNSKKSELLKGLEKLNNRLDKSAKELDNLENTIKELKKLFPTK